MHAAVLALIRSGRLDAAQAARLWQLSGLYAPPEGLAARLERGLAAVSALLWGAALVFWVAGQWPAWPASARLALLQGGVLLPVLLALAWPPARSALLLLATLALGALLALVGQTYQTGADAWQLFALWAALALPWVCAQRSDALWALWCAIAGVALASATGLRMFTLWSLWSPPWGGAIAELRALGWAGLFLLPLLLPSLRLLQEPHARWSWRVAALLALVAWGSEGLAALWTGNAAGVLSDGCLPPLLFCLAALALAWRLRARDLAVLALALAAVDVLLLAGAARWLFTGAVSDEILQLLLMLLLSALCVGSSAAWLHRLQRAGASA